MRCDGLKGLPLGFGRLRLFSARLPVHSMRFHPVSAQFLPLVYSGTRAARAAFGLSHRARSAAVRTPDRCAPKAGERFRPSRTAAASSSLSSRSHAASVSVCPVSVRTVFSSASRSAFACSNAAESAARKPPSGTSPSTAAASCKVCPSKSPPQRAAKQISRSFQPLCAAPFRNQRAPVQTVLRSPLLRTAPQAPDVCASRTPDMARPARA